MDEVYDVDILLLYCSDGGDALLGGVCLEALLDISSIGWDFCVLFCESMGHM